MRIKYDMQVMKYISLFESLTRAKVKDCIVDSIHDSRLIIVVEENEMGKAIGKNGVHVKRLEQLLKKRLKVVEYNHDVLQFIKNFTYPLQLKEVRQENNSITLMGPDTKTKGLLIGRDSANLNQLKAIVQRYFTVEGIKVI